MRRIIGKLYLSSGGVMTYDTLFEQIKTVPQEYLADIEKYVGYVLSRYKKNSETISQHDLSKYFGSIKMQRDALVMQKELRDEWD